jgi:site-specific recombinase XerD
MSDIINDYLDELEATRYIAASTKKLYLLELILLKESINKDLREVNKQELLSFFSNLRGKIEDSTVNKKKTVIKMFYAWLEDQGKIDKSPFYKLNFKITKTHKKYRILTSQEIKDMLLDRYILRKISNSESKTAFKKLRGQCVLRILISTWIRRKELINLEIQDCNIKNRTLYIRNTKTKHDRTVYFDKDTATWLEMYLIKRKSYASGYNNIFIDFNGDPLDEDRIDDIIKFRFWQARIKGKFDGIKYGKGLGAHTFRRTGATHALRNGADLKTIQLLLGHTDIATTAKYLFPSDEDLKNSYDKINIIDKIYARPDKRKKKNKVILKKDIDESATPKFDEGLL